MMSPKPHVLCPSFIFFHAGFTPAQLQTLLNTSPQQLNQILAQLNAMDISNAGSGLGAGLPSANLGAGVPLIQQQKLAAAAAVRGFAPQPPQRPAARPMLTLQQQQQLQQLYAQQAAAQQVCLSMQPSGLIPLWCTKPDCLRLPLT
jgi:hypothetical protein